jgi:hypothetical protein
MVQGRRRRLPCSKRKPKCVVHQKMGRLPRSGKRIDFRGLRCTPWHSFPVIEWGASARSTRLGRRCGRTASRERGPGGSTSSPQWPGTDPAPRAARVWPGPARPRRFPKARAAAPLRITRESDCSRNRVCATWLCRPGDIIAPVAFAESKRPRRQREVWATANEPWLVEVIAVGRILSGGHPSRAARKILARGVP